MNIHVLVQHNTLHIIMQHKRVYKEGERLEIRKKNMIGARPALLSAETPARKMNVQLVCCTSIRSIQSNLIQRFPFQPCPVCRAVPSTQLSSRTSAQTIHTHNTAPHRNAPPHEDSTKYIRLQRTLLQYTIIQYIYMCKNVFG